MLFTDISEGILRGGIWRLSLDKSAEPEVILNSAANERHPKLSPDGHWIAYTANESDRREVFVQSFPVLGAKHQISIAGGGEPVWSPDGRELFFREGGQLLVAELTYQPFRAGQPQVLFTGDVDYDAAPLTGHQHIDIAPDGKRFLMIRHDEPIGPSEVRVVLHWSEEL